MVVTIDAIDKDNNVAIEGPDKQREYWNSRQSG